MTFTFTIDAFPGVVRTSTSAEKVLFVLQVVGSDIAEAHDYSTDINNHFSDKGVSQEYDTVYQQEPQDDGTQATIYDTVSSG